MPSPEETSHLIREHHPLVVILGPTAVGKTEISLTLAERLNGEIISADSRLFYRGMDIGTAKPSAEEQGRVPHHLIDVVSPDETLSLAVFQQQAQAIISDVQARGRLPFLVGGTGQYVRAVVEGWQPPAIGPDPRLRRALEAWAEEIGPPGLHERLASLDPQAAERIDFRNVRRTIRALEVIFSSGRRFSDQRQKSGSPYSVLKLGLTRPRQELYQRVDSRIDTMMAAGLVEEVRALLGKGYSPDLPAFSAIGYRQILDSLLGKISLEQAVVDIRRSTRVFVRRQANWFKAEDPQIHWFSARPGVEDAMIGKIRMWISSGFSSKFI
jgi:tRNA dimethylallyltransferase